MIIPRRFLFIALCAFMLGSNSVYVNLLYFRGCDVKSRIYELFFAEPVAPSTAPTGTCRMSNRPV